MKKRKHILFKLFDYDNKKETCECCGTESIRMLMFKFIYDSDWLCAYCIRNCASVDRVWLHNAKPEPKS